MGDHYHSKGEWMVSARYMRMLMSGNRTGTTDLADQDILALSQLSHRSNSLPTAPSRPAPRLLHIEDFILDRILDKSRIT